MRLLTVSWNSLLKSDKSSSVIAPSMEEGVRKGLYSDAKGTAYLILNGTLFNTYNVYIDRRRITKAGSIISFESLLKSYSPEEIQIRYDNKEQRMPSLDYYRDSKKGKK